MIIQKKLLAKWKELRSPKDFSKMSERIEGGYPELFARAFRTGKCSDEVFQVIADFYKEKEELIKQYI